MKKFLKLLFSIVLFLVISGNHFISQSVPAFALENTASAESTLELNRSILDYLGKSNPSSFLSTNNLGMTNEQISEIRTKALEIVGTTTNDYEKTRLIHNWITSNIYYNYDGYLSGDYGDNTPYAVYTTRYAVCEGYSQLTNAMLRLLNIPSVVLWGYAIYASQGDTWDWVDEYSYNHAWNAVFVNGTWILVDTTWDTYNRFTHGEYVQSTTEDTYFDPTIETFSIDHRTIAIRSITLFVSFDAQGGRNKYSGAFTYYGMLASYVGDRWEPTKTGYVFGGWYKEPELINALSYSQDRVFSDITLYAKWITLPVTGISLDLTDLSLSGVGMSKNLTATISPSNASNKRISWSSDNTAVVSVDSYGKVTSKGIGTATITVKTEDGGFIASATVTVTPVSVTGITFDKQAIQMAGLNSTHSISATILPNNATNRKMTWSSDNTSIATVDATGKITSKGFGTATITATTEDGGFIAAATVTITPTLVSGIKIDQSTLKLEGINTTSSLKVTISPANATNKKVTWSSDNPAIVTVDANGKVTTKGIGSASITATSEDGGYTATSVVTVVEPAPVLVDGITLDRTVVDLIGINTTTTLIVTISPANATNQKVSWSSDNTNVVSVDEIGLVTSVGAGTATITVTTEDGSMTASVIVTVTVPPSLIETTGVTLNKNAVTFVGVGAKEKLIAMVSPTDATNKQVTWSSSNPAVAIVSANGNIEAVGVGRAMITVTTEDGVNSATAEITVTTNEDVKGEINFTLVVLSGVSTVLLGSLFIFRKSIFEKNIR